MAVKYKKNGTWYDISSSSNNAVDAVENGNLNPVTSNAVYAAMGTRWAWLPPNKTITVDLFAVYEAVLACIQLQGIGARLIDIEHNNTTTDVILLRDGTIYNTTRGGTPITIGVLTITNTGTKQFTIRNNGSETELISITGPTTALTVA